MDSSKIIYLCFLSISLLFAVFGKKREAGLKVFPYLLGISLFTEILAEVMAVYDLNYYLLYHFYVPIEYSMWGAYFYLTIDQKKIKQLILFSVFLFSGVCLFLSLKAVTIQKFPSVQLNIESILLVILAVVTIFTIKVEQNRSIFVRPVFWVCSGVLIYYTGITSFMGMYNFILVANKELLNLLRIYLLIVPNCILYTCLSIAFLCTMKMK